MATKTPITGNVFDCSEEPAEVTSNLDQNTPLPLIPSTEEFTMYDLFSYPVVSDLQDDEDIPF